jgi:hypothetical protein
MFGPMKDEEVIESVQNCLKTPFFLTELKKTCEMLEPVR